MIPEQIITDEDLVQTIDEIKHRLKARIGLGKDSPIATEFNDLLNMFIADWGLDSDSHAFATLPVVDPHRLIYQSRTTAILEDQVDEGYHTNPLVEALKRQISDLTLRWDQAVLISNKAARDRDEALLRFHEAAAELEKLKGLTVLWRRRVGALREFLIARRAMEPKHSREDHECPECEALSTQGDVP